MAAQAGRDGHGGVDDDAQLGPRVGATHPVQLQPQCIDDLLGGAVAERHGGQAVDVRAVQAGVAYGGQRGIESEVETGALEAAARLGQAEARDDDARLELLHHTPPAAGDQLHPGPMRRYRGARSTACRTRSACSSTWGARPRTRQGEAGASKTGPG